MLASLSRHSRFRYTAIGRRAMSASGTTPSNVSTNQHEIQTSIKHGLGIITLNRPRVLNSLNLNMVQSIQRVLTDWSRPSSGVHCVLVRGSGDKAFCAGGDVKNVVLDAMAGRYQGPDAFFEAEYAMNLQISRLRIPYVALIDGIVMGGGVGVSLHGHFRIATERTVLAMPECGIGLFPDIGSSYILTSLPGSLGTYLAITGARVTGVTVREAGLATHYLPSTAMAQVEQALCALPAEKLSNFGAVAHTLDQLQAAQGPLPQDSPRHKLCLVQTAHPHVTENFMNTVCTPGELNTLLPLVNMHFGHASLHHIHASLLRAQKQLEAIPGSQQTAADSWAFQFIKSSLQALHKGSPLSQAVSYRLIQRAAHAPLSTCLASDSVMVGKFVRGQGDFYEGVRATLIDKTKPPVWKYSSIDQVPDHVVESFFEGGPFAVQHKAASKL